MHEALRPLISQWIDTLVLRLLNEPMPDQRPIRFVIIFNITEREDGQPRAIQPQSLFDSQQFATTVYQSESSYGLRELGYEITVGRSGAPGGQGI
jgi:hypothetical protein